MVLTAPQSVELVMKGVLEKQHGSQNLGQEGFHEDYKEISQKKKERGIVEVYLFMCLKAGFQLSVVFFVYKMQLL